ncbi:MAG: hypothetical protein P4K93_00625 [Terracidiphilus sp.]|nr:hypothetical protein [Terracidiphilus sp.]MDR3796622.1 hypothetical protein [Terracidiphilus sp.]
MILGIDAGVFTALHVALSLCGIGAGIVVLIGFAANKLYGKVVFLFLVSTALVDATGFAFPNSQITPAIVVGVLSLISLAIAGTAIYMFHLTGRWRTTFVIGAMVALYFNVFVLVAQMFKHVPVLTRLDPKQSGPPFGIAELIVLAAFVWLTVLAVKRFTAKRSISTAA